jgi:hypothetical protein
MSRITVSKVGPDKKIDVEIKVSELDRVEGYQSRETLNSRVALTKESGSKFLIPKGTEWKIGEEINIIINYPRQYLN